MPGPTFLHGSRIELRVVEEEDLPYLQALINDPAVWSTLFQNRPLSMDDEREWLDQVRADDGRLHLLICEDEEPRGIVGLSEIDANWGTAEVGYYIDPAHTGNGFATEAVGVLLEYAFDQLRLEKLRADVIASNVASARVLEKNGFVEEGCLRDHAYIDGARQDVRLYGRLPSD